MAHDVGVIRRFWDQEHGATMVEYGVMLALIALVCVAAVTLIGQRSSTTFTTAAAKVGST